MSNNAHQTFEAMTTEERQNLAKLAYWSDPSHTRGPGDYLIGPQYVALWHHGVIAIGDPDRHRGTSTIITDLGRAVLHYVEGGL